MQYLKKISFYYIIFLGLSACNTYKKVGTFKYSSHWLGETLILNEKSNAKFSSISVPKTGRIVMRCGADFYDTYVSGYGNYQIRNDSIYLNFIREKLKFTEENIEMKITKHEHDTSKLNFHFDDIYFGIKIVNKGKEIAESGFDDTLVEIDTKNFPITLTIDFSKSAFNYFNNYTLILTKTGDYKIDLSMYLSIIILKDLVFPISKYKDTFQIGKMKHRL